MPKDETGPIDNGAENHEMITGKFGYAAESIPSEKHPDSNEDAWFANPDHGIFAVFDGVGGSDEGEVASYFAAEILKGRAAIDTSGMSDEGKKKDMVDYLTFVNKYLYDQSQRSKKVAQTTATIVSAYEKEEGYNVLIGNVGDSRAYKFSNGKLEQITIDDGNVKLKYPDSETTQRKVQSRLNNATNVDSLSPEERDLFKKRRVITQALGTAKIDPGIYDLSADQGDFILLTSDGVHDNLTDDALEKAMKISEDPEVIKRVIINAAISRSHEPNNPRAKRDDMTVLVIRLGTTDKDHQPAHHTQQPEVKTNDEVRNTPEQKIEDSRSFDDLFAALKKIGGLQGTESHYTSEKLILIINQVRGGERDLKNITRTAGLRKKVAELIEIDKQRAQISKLESADNDEDEGVIASTQLPHDDDSDLGIYPLTDNKPDETGLYSVKLGQRKNADDPGYTTVKLGGSPWYKKLIKKILGID